VARSLGWKVHMRCANGYRREIRSMRRSVYRKQLKGAPEANLRDGESIWLPRPFLSSAEVP
jgi:hypothetical protein